MLEMSAFKLFMLANLLYKLSYKLSYEAIV